MLDLNLDLEKSIEFKDVLEILKALGTVGVIAYFDGLLGNAINRIYAITKNKENEIDLEYKLYLTFILLKLTLYRTIYISLKLEQKFSNRSNLIEINSKLGDDISKAETLDREILDKELKYNVSVTEFSLDKLFCENLLKK